jgi:hypothetical protein
VDEAVRRLVSARAGQICEYCHLSQTDAPSFRFHIEHVRPRQHGGATHPDNLALACPNCNWRKGPNLTAIDLDTETVVPLFNPRKQIWKEHFASVGAQDYYASTHASESKSGSQLYGGKSSSSSRLPADKKIMA